MPVRGEALASWRRLGCIRFSGPARLIALMQEDLAARGGWISTQRFLHAQNDCSRMPRTPTADPEKTGRGRMAGPFGFALADPSLRLSRTRRFPKVTRGLCVARPRNE